MREVYVTISEVYAQEGTYDEFGCECESLGCWGSF